jgi:hypothetical protein
MDNPNDELAALQLEIEEATWRKTNYIEPHEYIIKTDVPELWDKIAKYIDTHSYTKEFKGNKYRYANIGNYRYWHFDLTLNRALNKVEDEQPA